MNQTIKPTNKEHFGVFYDKNLLKVQFGVFRINDTTTHSSTLPVFKLSSLS